MNSIGTIFGGVMLVAISMVPSHSLGAETPTALHVYPSEVTFTTIRDAQSLVVQAEYANGITRDVTDKVAWKMDGADVVSQEGNRLAPKADGNCKLAATFEGLSMTVPVTARRSTPIAAGIRSIRTPAAMKLSGTWTTAISMTRPAV